MSRRAARRLALALLAVVAVVLVAVFGLAGTSGVVRPCRTRAAERTAVGAHATLASLLSSAHGKPVLVVFWASWCGPCSREAPALERFSQQQPRAVTRIVGVDWSDARSGGAFVHRPLPLDVPQRSATLRARSATPTGSPALPTTFVVNDRHRIVAELSGPQSEGSLEQALAQRGKVRRRLRPERGSPGTTFSPRAKSSTSATSGLLRSACPLRVITAGEASASGIAQDPAEVGEHHRGHRLRGGRDRSAGGDRREHLLGVLGVIARARRGCAAIVVEGPEPAPVAVHRRVDADEGLLDHLLHAQLIAVGEGVGPREASTTRASSRRGCIHVPGSAGGRWQTARSTSASHSFVCDDGKGSSRKRRLTSG